MSEAPLRPVDAAPLQDDELLVTYAEAAARLSVGRRTIERMVAGGELPIVHVRGRPRIHVSDLRELMNARVRRGGRERPSSPDSTFAERLRSREQREREAH